MSGPRGHLKRREARLGALDRPWPSAADREPPAPARCPWLIDRTPESYAATDQVNLTDEQSRFMHVAGGGFEQRYNAQATYDKE